MFARRTPLIALAGLALASGFGCVIDEKLGDPNAAATDDGDDAGPIADSDTEGGSTSGGSGSGQNTGDTSDGTAGGSTAATTGPAQAPCDQLCFDTCAGQWPDGPQACMEACQGVTMPQAAAPAECTALGTALIQCFNQHPCGTDPEVVCAEELSVHDDTCSCWMSGGGDGGTTEEEACFTSWFCYGEDLEVSCAGDTCECYRNKAIAGSCDAGPSCDAGLLGDPAAFALDCCGFDVPPDDVFPG